MRSGGRTKEHLGSKARNSGFSRMKFPLRMQFLCKLPVEAKEKEQKRFSIFGQSDIMGDRWGGRAIKPPNQFAAARQKEDRL